MKNFLRSYFAMLIAMFSFLYAPSVSAQSAQPEAYVVEGRTKITFYYDAKRATRKKGKVWSITETKSANAAGESEGEGEEENATRAAAENGPQIPAWAGTESNAKDEITQVVFDASFKNYRPTSTKQWFFHLAGVETIVGLENLNTEAVTNMSEMFLGCEGLETLDLQSFNTAKVTNMSGMFKGCYSLTSINVQSFNTANVTDMSYMFDQCRSLATIDLNNFNSDKVTDARRMFDECGSLTTINCKNTWRENISSEYMFGGCVKLQGAAKYNSSKVDAAMANPKTGYFTGKATEEENNTPGKDENNTPGNDENGTPGENPAQPATPMAYVVESKDKTNLTFYYDAEYETRANAGNVMGIEEKKVDNSAAEDGNEAGNADDNGANAADNAEAGDTDNAETNAADNSEANAAGENEEENKVPVWVGTEKEPNTTITKVVFDASFKNYRPTSTEQWFSYLTKLKNFEGLENLNTEEVTSMSEMFFGCASLKELNLQNFNTAKVTDMSSMFAGCTGLTSLNLTTFNTENVTNMSGMFGACASLTTLDLQNFNTANVADMRQMFTDCSNLTTINCTNTWKEVASDDMFKACEKLKGAVNYDATKTTAAMANPETGYFTGKTTAVNSVRQGEFGSQSIYTLQGKRVKGAWQHLPAGVYVVNGKKVIK
jgi:hypothetical protein